SRQLPAPQNHSNWDQNQTDEEEAGQCQEKNDSGIGRSSGTAAENNFEDPVGDHGDRAAGGEDDADERNGISAEIENGADPRSKTFLHWHGLNFLDEFFPAAR